MTKAWAIKLQEENKQTRNLFSHNWTKLSRSLLKVIPSETASSLRAVITADKTDRFPGHELHSPNGYFPIPPSTISTKGSIFALLSIIIQKRNVTVLSGFSISLTHYQVYICQLNSGISQFFPWVGSCRLYQMLSLSLCKHDPWTFNLCDSSSIPLPVV